MKVEIFREIYKVGCSGRQQADSKVLPAFYWQALRNDKGVFFQSTSLPPVHLPLRMQGLQNPQRGVFFKVSLPTVHFPTNAPTAQSPTQPHFQSTYLQSIRPHQRNSNTAAFSGYIPTPNPFAPNDATTAQSPAARLLSSLPRISPGTASYPAPGTSQPALLPQSLLTCGPVPGQK